MRILFLATLAVFLWSIVLFPPGAVACSCNAGHSACGEVSAGSAVFTGKVLSVSPPFVNRLNSASRTQADRVTRFYDQLNSGEGQTLPSLKETFRELIPALSPDQIRRLKEANSRQALLRLFDLILDHGSYVTLEIGTVFTAGHDDDDDALTAGKVFSVWTPTFDCGIEFQVGETYLVYASADEDTDMVETDTCMGTRRLSDAGADLPYLSFLKADPEESGHLDGFVTADPLVRANPPANDQILSPVSGVLIELKSDDATRYATSDKEGRFVFDGLDADSYRIVGYRGDYPDPTQVLGDPEELKIKPKSCARHIVVAQPRQQVQ